MMWWYGRMVRGARGMAAWYVDNGGAAM